MKVTEIHPLPEVHIDMTFREAQMLRALLTHINDETWDYETPTTNTRGFVNHLKKELEKITGTDRNDFYLDIKSSMVLKRFHS